VAPAILEGAAAEAARASSKAKPNDNVENQDSVTTVIDANSRHNDDVGNSLLKSRQIEADSNDQRPAKGENLITSSIFSVS